MDHAVRWAVEAWKVDVKRSTLEYCFCQSQVKIHGPALQQPLEVDDAKDSEGDIFDCIGVLMPRSLPSRAMVQAFVAPEDVDSDEDLEEATYQIILGEDSDDGRVPGPEQCASIQHH